MQICALVLVTGHTAKNMQQQQQQITETLMVLMACRGEMATCLVFGFFLLHCQLWCYLLIYLF